MMFARRPSMAVAIALAALLSSCAMPGSSALSGSDASPSSVVLTDYSGSFSYTVDPGSDAKDVYFIFSNTSLDTNAGASTVKRQLGTINVDGVDIAGTSLQPAGGPLAAGGRSSSPEAARDFLANSNRDPMGFMDAHPVSVQASRMGNSGPRADTIGGGGVFKDLDATGEAMTSIAATCRLVQGPISTSQGNRTLNVWVANDCWSATGSEGTGTGQKRHLVTQAMVQSLADAFLKDGSNDIYAYDTSVLGPEWGDPSQTSCSFKDNLIPFTGDITILISDIMTDNSDTGGVVGYFWDVNDYKTSYYSDSNARVMFVVDAVMLANPSTTGATGTGENGWDSSSSYWAKKVFSTLAHEFQHMIQFYRKGILIRGDGVLADTWIDEMCSQLMEDLIADKLGVEGPRGVAATRGDSGDSDNSSGRIPYFNYLLSSNYALNDSNYSVYDYSFSYAFGSWLARNFGGASFLRNVVYDANTDSGCIEDAVSKGGGSWSMADLISRWAVAVLGSSSTDMPPGYQYNTGTWISSAMNGVTYKLGSIDFFKYYPTPQVRTSSSTTGSITTASNVYYRAASGLSSPRTWQLKVPSGVSFSVYVRP
jgi:hypothetical protein